MQEKAIHQYMPGDYNDTFSIEVENNKLTPKEIISAIFGYTPSWLRALFIIRTCIVKPFGIETKPLTTHNLIIQESEQEAIMRKDDKHLLFYIDIFITPSEGNKQTIEVTTLVKYHNYLGKAYFFCIKPFHRVLVPWILKKVVNNDFR